MSETNGHTFWQAVATKPPVLAFEYRTELGSTTTVRRVRPYPGSLDVGKDGWQFGALDLDTRAPCLIVVSRIAMVYGTVDLTMKGKPGRCLCGALEPADCGCESRAAAKADGGAR